MGNGSHSTAQDSVPFVLWFAATHADDYRVAVTACVEAGGDMDTTAAMVGGIVACRTGVPADWPARREPLPPA
ncbi:ADP-ribosylglycohydrolase family protein [Saccharothrix texasensis]|uniref:ADP-ribosylglycohydrolase family protein n=1 Tax=Saccharothrix texasensis TaxID=103734 RepID=UPI001FE33F19|nr:ADP-ribosylglycohydrolase family protein [Saccharothrix texasensis]